MNTTAAQAEVVLRSMRPDEANLALFRACFAKNADRPQSHEALRWQYLAGPTGKLFVDVAVAPGGEELAAIYATLPGTMQVHGKPRLAVQSLDTLTDAAFRGRGLFLALARRTYARAESEGAALVYGFPNGQSAPGFFGKLGWTSLDPVPFLLRPLRTAYFTGKIEDRLPEAARAFVRALPDLPLALPLAPRIPKGLRLREIARFDARVDDLWREFARGIDYAIERSEAYLAWRLLDKPGERYTLLALERGNRLEALCVYTVKEKHGGRVGYVMELLHRPGAWRAGSAILGRAVHAMAEARADAVLGWCFSHSPNRRAYARRGFFTLPPRLRPIELHVGVRAFDPALTDAGDRRRWYLSYLDSDTV